MADENGSIEPGGSRNWSGSANLGAAIPTPRPLGSGCRLAPKAESSISTLSAAGADAETANWTSRSPARGGTGLDRSAADS